MSKADIVLHNARVITLEPETGPCSAVAIGNGLILGTGRLAGLEGLIGPETRVVDCRDKTIVPGFIDAHCHIMATAAKYLGVDCSPEAVKSIAGMVKLIAEKAEKTPEGTWIRCTGYNEFYLREKRHPDRNDLDRATTRHPVKLTHRSGHATVLNSPGMAIAGINNQTPEPPGAIIERDLSAGLPDGVLFGMEHYLDKFIPPFSEKEMEEGIRAVNRHFISKGITSIHDATGRNTLVQFELFRKIVERKWLQTRVYMMFGTEDLEELLKRNFLKKQATPFLKPGGIKIYLDEVSGNLNPSQEELNRMVLTVHKNNRQVAIHAVEENTVRAAIIALKEADKLLPRRDSRRRIEHCSVCPPELMAGLAELKIMVVTQPSFLYNSGERYLRTVPEQQLPWLYPIGSLLKMGIEVAGGSDSPVDPAGPLEGIYAAVARRAGNGEEVNVKEAVSPFEALKMFTLSAARASFEENIKGTIKAGKVADLVILDKNPLAVPVEEIKYIQVLAAMIDGKFAWQENCLYQ